MEVERGEPLHGTGEKSEKTENGKEGVEVSFMGDLGYRHGGMCDSGYRLDWNAWSSSCGIAGKRRGEQHYHNSQ